MTHDRAWILLPSGRRLDLSAPDQWAWTDRDLAIGLSRTYRWAGYSAWDLPLSVAQHSLTVLAFCRCGTGTAADRCRGAPRATARCRGGAAGRLGSITPLRPYLGDGFARLVARLQAAIDARYTLPPWTAESDARHKHADRLAAASEAHHVAGWSREALREHLGITLEPAAQDPLPLSDALRPVGAVAAEARRAAIPGRAANPYHGGRAALGIGTRAPKDVRRPGDAAWT